VFKETPLLTDITRENIAKKYRFEKVLGEGAYGKVKVASLRANPSKKFAIKSIPRSLFSKNKDGSLVLKKQKSSKNSPIQHADLNYSEYNMQKQQIPEGDPEREEDREDDLARLQLVERKDTDGSETRQFIFSLLQQEIQVVMGMEHPNIVKFH
jgi:serine/threonine protein kinase